MSRLPSLLPPGSPRSPLSLISKKLPGPITPANSFKKPSTPPPYKYQALSWALAEGWGWVLTGASPAPQGLWGPLSWGLAIQVRGPSPSGVGSSEEVG